MIYYLRRLNSHTASAETFNIPVTSGTNINCGTICSISNGYLSPYRDSSKANYLTLESKISGDGKSHISCVRLAPEMVLKATPCDSISDYKIGDNCSFYANTEEITTGIGHSGNDAEVIGIENNYVIFVLK